MLTPNAETDAWLAGVSVSPLPQPVAKRLKLDAVWYRKYVDVMGIPVVGSAGVRDEAMLEAAYIARLMLQHRADVAAKLASKGVRLAVMSVHELTRDIPEHRFLPRKFDEYRGVGATPERPAVSCGEENLLACPGDPYDGENILVHEFAHTIHMMGMRFVDRSFDGRLTAAYRAALAEGKWAGTYAAVDAGEYFGEGTQSYFNCNPSKPNEWHNDVDTREELERYDPKLFHLVREVFGPATWKYVPCTGRASQPHLRNLDRSTLPKFAWPKQN